MLATDSPFIDGKMHSTEIPNSKYQEDGGEKKNGYENDVRSMEQR